MLAGELDGFQSHVLKTPHNEVNQDYVRNMIEVVYPQRIAESVSEELRDRYVESVKKIRKKKGQHAVAWAILVFQSAFQLVRDETWDLVWREYDANLKPWQPVAAPNARVIVSMAVVFGVLVVTLFVRVTTNLLSDNAMGLLNVACAVGYGALLLGRQRALLGIIAGDAGSPPNNVRRMARTEILVHFGLVIGLFAVAALFFTNKPRASAVPLPSTFAAKQMMAVNDRFGKKVDDLNAESEAGVVDKEEFKADVEGLEAEATRLLDVVYPAIVGSYYGEENRNKFQSEIQQARRKGSRDLFNLEIAGTFIQSLLLRESSREVEELKSRLERLFSDPKSHNP